MTETDLESDHAVGDGRFQLPYTRLSPLNSTQPAVIYTQPAPEPASATDSNRPEAESHPDSGPDSRSGATVESRLCLPCRGQPGSRTMGARPHLANPAR